MESEYGYSPGMHDVVLIAGKIGMSPWESEDWGGAPFPSRTA